MKCKKCGGTEAEILYLPVGTYVPWGNYSTWDNLMNYARNDTSYKFDEINKECLKITCKTCGYVYLKDTLSNSAGN